MMNAAERFVKICGEIGNYTEKKTGVSVVDAYTGPEEFHPKKQSNEKTPAELVHAIHQTFDKLRDEIEEINSAIAILLGKRAEGLEFQGNEKFERFLNEEGVDVVCEREHPCQPSQAAHQRYCCGLYAQAD